MAIPSEKVCLEVQKTLNLISNKIRMKVLCMLMERDYSATEIREKLKVKPSNLSQQLKLLVTSDFIESRRENKFVHYSLKNNKIRDLLEYFENHFMG